MTGPSKAGHDTTSQANMLSNAGRYAPDDPRFFGAAGDGIHADTAAIQCAIDTVAAAGGGRVRIGPGRYLCGAITLKSDIEIFLEAGAVILGSPDPDDYPVIGARWEGRTHQVYAPLIGGNGLRNVSITGRGCIDGQGGEWWRRFREKSLSFPRPRLISFADCETVFLEGFTARNSPSWTINPVRCTNVRIHGLTILNPADSPNTDGINPDSCSGVRISDCFVSVGDDCITLKAGTEYENPELQAPCRDICITNCVLEAGHGGVVIGSEMSGGVHNVVISNCVFKGTDRGIRLKSRRGRGGVVENINVSNIVMEDVLCPFTVNLYYGCGAWGDPVVADKAIRPTGPGTPLFRSIHLRGIDARGITLAAAFIYGLAEMPVSDLTFSDCSFRLAPHSERTDRPGDPADHRVEMGDGLPDLFRAGFYARNVTGIGIHNVRIEGQIGPDFDIE